MSDLITKLLPILHVADPDAERRFYEQLGLRTTYEGQEYPGFIALAELRNKGVDVARHVSDQGWGLLAAIRLPDGGELPIYQPRHPSPR